MAELELQPTAEERDEFQMDDGDGKLMLEEYSIDRLTI